MKLLSLDQATAKTGIAIHCGSELTLYDLIDLEKEKVGISERVYVMIDRICGVIHKHNPDYVVLEDVVMQINPETLILLARFQGTIIGYCHAHNIPYSILKSSSWRKALGFKQGKGVKRPDLKSKQKIMLNPNMD